MITIGIHDHLPAPDHHVEHDLVGAGMPREHGFQTVGDPRVAGWKADVDQLTARDGGAVRVVPQPRHVGHD